MEHMVRVDEEVLEKISSAEAELAPAGRSKNKALRKLLGLDAPPVTGQPSIERAVRLQTGTVIEHPSLILNAYLRREGGARAYDTLPQPATNILEEPHLSIINKLGGRGIPAEAAAQLVARGQSARAALEKIPADASIFEADEHLVALRELFQVCLQPPIRYLGLSRTSKILHRFRPNLIPILDNKLIDSYYRPAARLSGEWLPTYSIDRAMACLDILRADAMANRDILEQLGEQFLRTPLRALDILLWRS